MSVASGMKSLGGGLLGLVMMVGIMAIGIAILMGLATFSLWALKWTFPAFLVTLLISLVLLAPTAFIPPTRAFSAVGFLLASFVLGAILWIWGMAYAYTVWGMFGVIIGLVLGGIGVVPVAMFAALVHGDWATLAMLVITAVVTIGYRVLAHWLGEKADERTARLRRSEITVSAYEVLE